MQFVMIYDKRSIIFTRCTNVVYNKRDLYVLHDGTETDDKMMALSTATAAAIILCIFDVCAWH